MVGIISGAACTTTSPEELREVIEIFYLRPGNLRKDFFAAAPLDSVDSKGRPRKGYDIDQGRLIRAVLAKATPQEMQRWDQVQHPITHTVVSNGKALAKPGELLVHDGRKFLIQGVDEPGELGLACIYYVEEREDF